MSAAKASETAAWSAGPAPRPDAGALPKPKAAPIPIPKTYTYTFTYLGYEALLPRAWRRNFAAEFWPELLNTPIESMSFFVIIAGLPFIHFLRSSLSGSFALYISLATEWAFLARFTKPLHGNTTRTELEELTGSSTLGSNVHKYSTRMDGRFISAGGSVNDYQ